MLWWFGCRKWQMMVPPVVGEQEFPLQSHGWQLPPYLSGLPKYPRAHLRSTGTHLHTQLHYQEQHLDECSRGIVQRSQIASRKWCKRGQPIKSHKRPQDEMMNLVFVFGAGDDSLYDSGFVLGTIHFFIGWKLFFFWTILWFYFGVWDFDDSGTLLDY